MKPQDVHLGFAVGTGEPVSVPVRHLAVTGQTQLSGKTTTLEALVARSGLRAIAFVTKRAEGGFSSGHPLPPYFRERADWQFVSSVLEATLRERLKFERSWIMRACKGARSLADVRRNVQTAMLKAKGMSADVYLTLDHYLDIVIPQVERLPYVDEMRLRDGLNVMDLSSYTMELQALVIRSVLEWTYEEADNTLVIIPEAWEFVPQQRGSPVLLACEQLIRKGGASRNFVWLDSQDIAGVHKNILRSVGVWIIGVQRERNEVRRALDHIPGGVRKPGVDDVMGLERGQFFACWEKTVVKVYVQPQWMIQSDARNVALGKFSPDVFAAPKRKIEKEDVVNEREAAALREENASLRRRIQELEQKPIQRLAAPAYAPDPPGKAEGARPVVPADYETIRERLLRDPAVLAVLASRPEIDVEVRRVRIEASDQTLYGRLAILVAEGYFDEPRNGNTAWNELKRRGQSSAKPNVYRELDKLASQGFLTKESGGYQSVVGMKVNIREAA